MWIIQPRVASHSQYPHNVGVRRACGNIRWYVFTLFLIGVWLSIFWFISLTMSLVYIHLYPELWINKVHVDLAERPRALHETSSFSEHIVSNTGVTRDKNLQRRNRDKARRDKLTPEQKEEMNARRRAVRKNKTNEEWNASQRAARQNLTPNERQEINAHRREASKNKPAEERQEINAHQRARRQSVPPEERQVMRAQRNTWLAAKRNTPCAESIAMPRPGAYLFWITVLWYRDHHFMSIFCGNKHFL
jgi:hypothetical protein